MEKLAQQIKSLYGAMAVDRSIGKEDKGRKYTNCQ
jgi:hypothetical protein